MIYLRHSSKKTKYNMEVQRMKRRILSFILVVAMVVGYVPMSVWADGETGIGIVVPDHPIPYSEGQGEETVLNEISITVGTDGDGEKILFAGGYFNVDIDERKDYETLALSDGIYEGYVDQKGKVYDVEVLNGEIILIDKDGKKEPIGRVNPNYDGKLDSEGDPLPLRVDFSTPLENGDFREDEGDILFGENGQGSIKGWTIRKTNGTGSKAHQIWLGDLATRTQGKSVTTTTISNGLYKVANGEHYEFFTDFNYGGSKTGWKFEGVEREFANGTAGSNGPPGNYVANIGSDYNESLLYDIPNADQSRGNVLKLGFNKAATVKQAGELDKNSGAYGTVFGPDAISTAFEAKEGDKIAFDWRAFIGMNAQGNKDTSNYDDYEVYGFLVKDESSDIGSIDNKNHILIMYGRGAVQRWTTNSFTIPEDGNYKFRFVAGSYDNTGGLKLGATLHIDNIRLFKKVVDSKLVEFIAKNITYENTEVNKLVQELMGNGKVLQRTVTVEASGTTNDTSSQKATAKANVQIDLNEPPSITGGLVQEYTTPYNTPISKTIGASDPDRVNGKLTYKLSKPPSNGTVIVKSDGSWTYTPKNNFSGHDSFKVEVKDQDGGVTIVEIKINVGEVGTHWVTFDNEGETTSKDVKDGSTTTTTSPTREGYIFKGWNTSKDGRGTAFTSSTKVTDDITVYAQWEKIEGDTDEKDIGNDGSAGGNVGKEDTLTYVLREQPKKGTANVDPENGNWTYTPKQDAIGEDEFIIDVIDGNGKIVDEIPIKIWISDPDFPVDNNIEKEIDNNGEPTGGRVEPEGSKEKEITYEIGKSPAGGAGSVEKGSDGKANWTYTPGTNFKDKDDFTIVTKEDDKVIKETPVRVVETLYKTPVEIITPKPPKLGTVAGYEIKDGDKPKNGTVTGGTNGRWVYTPENGFTGEDEFTVTVTDRNGKIEEVIIKVIVREPRPKVDGTVTTTIYGVTYEIIDFQPYKGQATIDLNNGNWTYTPGNNFQGEDKFTILVKEDGNASVKIPVIIVETEKGKDVTIPSTGITNPNNYNVKNEAGPVGGSFENNSGNWTYKPGDSFEYDDQFVLVDKDGNEVIVKVIEKKALPEITGELTPPAPDTGEKTFVIKPGSGPLNGSAEVTKGPGEDAGKWTYIPEEGFTGEDGFIIEVWEKGKVIEEIPVTIRVKDPEADLVEKNKGPITGSVDSDLPKSNITYEILDTPTDKPKHGEVDLNEKTGSWKYIPGENFKGEDQFTITVKKDGEVIDKILIKINAKDNLNIEMKASPQSIVGNGTDTSVLTAQLFDKDTGKPIEKAGVEVEFQTPKGVFVDENGNELGKTVKVKTNNQGIANLTLKSEDLKSVTREEIDVTATVMDYENQLYGKDKITMTFEPTYVIGVVTDNVTGKPIPNTRVRVERVFEKGENTGKEFVVEVVTNDKGEYKIAVPEEGQYTITIVKETAVGPIEFKQNAVIGEVLGLGDEKEATKTLTGVLLSKDKDGNTRNFAKDNKGTIEIRGIGNDSDKVATINNSGVFTVEDLVIGKHEFSIVKKVKDKNGEEVELVVGKIVVDIDEDGEVAIHEELIDPYGTIRDSSTGKVLGDVHVQLYYADTPRNRVNGKTPGSLVPLPELPGFAPNDNKNGQYSTWNQVFNNHPAVQDHGNYAWMVFPESDYYIVATKPGYQDYRSPIISVEFDVVKHNFSMIPTTSGSGGSGDGLYYPPYIPSTPKEEPKKPTNNTPANIPTEITTDQRNYLEGTEGKIEIGYINKGGEVTGGKLVVSLPKDAEVIYLDGGKIVGDTIVWDLGQLKPGQEGRKNPIFKFPGISSSEETLYLKVQILEDGLGIGQGSFIEIRIFSNRYGNGKHSRYIVGHPDGEFKPDKSITRAEIAVIFARILELEDYVKNETIYTDVKPSDWYGRGVEAASRKGLFEGYENGEFRPNAPITRAELATVIARFLELPNTPPLEEVFKDIEGHWASNYIAELYRNNVVNGYADGLFKPQDKVKRSEAVTMFNRMLNRGPLKEVEASFPDVSLDHWANGDVEESTRFHYYFRNEDASETHIETYFEELKF